MPTRRRKKALADYLSSLRFAAAQVVFPIPIPEAARLSRPSRYGRDLPLRADGPENVGVPLGTVVRPR